MSNDNNHNSRSQSQLPSQSDMTDLMRRENFQIDPSQYKKKTGPTMQNDDEELVLLKTKFDEKLQLYRFMHENKNEHGKRISGDTRRDKWDEITELYNNLKLSSSPIGVYVMNTESIKWTTFFQDEKYWRLWDEQEEMVMEDKRNKERRNRFRREDKSGHPRNGSRSRSRSRDRNSNNKESREKVLCYGYTLVPFFLLLSLLIPFIHHNLFTTYCLMYTIHKNEQNAQLRLYKYCIPRICNDSYTFYCIYNRMYNILLYIQ